MQHVEIYQSDGLNEGFIQHAKKKKLCEKLQIFWLVHTYLKTRLQQAPVLQL
jgi:hypothetical protein